MLKAWPDKSLNQVAITTDCDNCGHCVELYTPTREDSIELDNTRWKIYDWIHKLFDVGKKGETQKLNKVTTFLE